MTNERMQLLRDAADDCESEANNLLNQAPNMGPTKERSYRRQADECIARATALRAWADEVAQVEPPAEPPITPPVDPDPIKNAKMKMHAYHLGKGPMPSWMELYQGFVAAHDAMVGLSENRTRD